MKTTARITDAIANVRRTMVSACGVVKSCGEIQMRMNFNTNGQQHLPASIYHHNTVFASTEPLGNPDLGDRSAARRAKLVLHLHGLDDHQGLTRHDGLIQV